MPKDDPHEQFVQVDTDDRVIEYITRSVAHANPEIIHRAVCVLIFNNKNQLLLQKRSEYKDMYPGYWSLSCAGHVTGKASYYETVKRELEEELGLNLNLKPFGKEYFRLEEESEMVQVYKAVFDGTVHKFDVEEIVQVTWIDLSQLDVFVRKNKFSPMDDELLRRFGFVN